MRLLITLLLLGITSQLHAAIEPVYEGSNGIRDNVLSVCMMCHSTTVSGGGRNGAPFPPNFNTYEDATLLGDNAVARAVDGSMPPAGYPRLNAQQKAALLAWQAAGFPEKSSVVSPPAGTSTTPVAVSQPDCLFNWAESNFANAFSPPVKSQTLSPYYYRFYPPSTYLAIAADSLLYFGPLSPSAIMNLGDVATWYARATCK